MHPSKPNIVILSHTEIGDCINHTPIIRYLSKYYEKVIMVLKNAESIRKNIPLFLEDCSNVQFDYVTLTQPNHYLNLVDFAAHMQKYDEATHELRYAGHFKKLVGGQLIIDTIPFMFYYDLRISPAVFWQHMHIPRLLSSRQLYALVQYIPYIFISPNSSEGAAFSVEQAEVTLGVTRNDRLFINSDYNCYEKGHVFYDIANLFVMQRVIDYVDVLENAEGVMVSDSCIYCLALHLNLRSPKCYFTTRYFDYSAYIYNEEYGYDKPAAHKFQCVRL
jgi:hypothetical protein